jgi:hypothetical protein
MRTKRGPNAARQNLLLLLVVAAVMTLIAAACGDDTETTDTGTASTDSGDTSDGDMSEGDMSEGDMSEMAHSHDEVINVPEGMAVPTVAITAEPDAKSGHNLFIELTDFTVAPERASTEAVDGEGHLHLYIDGERISRFYNTALHLTGLEPGDHTVEVELSANNHSAYAVDDEPIRAATTITVAETDGSVSHDHGEADLFESAAAPTIELSVTKDPKSGWNLFADVDGFEFAPESVNSEPVDGEGHLHLYLDGERVSRMYGPWWHLSGLTEGRHEVMVEVSANDHSPYGVDGAAVMAMATIEVSEAEAEAAAGHSGDTHDGDGHDGDGHDHAHAGTGEYTEGSADADVVITASYADGDLEIDDRRFSAENGQIVGIRFTSDVEEYVHVHGYDVLLKVGPDNPIDASFVADQAGSYEVEFEESGRFLFDLQVSQ